MEIIYKHFETLVSTNQLAKEYLTDLPKDALLVLSADEQTGGKGQYGRRWISPKGKNIYATYVFRATKEIEPLSLTHLLAISAWYTLKEYQVESYIKWPNDLIVEGKKIAGILCETVDLGFHFGVIAGIGLNVNMTREALETIGRPATSLQLETGREFAVKEILCQLTLNFSRELLIFLDKGIEPFAPLLLKILNKSSQNPFER